MSVVIIPPSGPPVVCFGCYSSFPPNVKIDTPEFCVQLFGHSIGRCPPDGNEDSGGDDENEEPDPDDDDDDDDEPDEEEDEEEECTESVTATYVSVFCTVTESKSLHLLSTL